MISLRPVLAAALLCLAPLAARAADACFSACLKPRMAAPDVDDETIREALSACRARCDEATRARLAAAGGESALACAPSPLSPEEFRKVRSASPSVVGLAGAFLWEVDNVLPDKVVRRVEISTQNMSLQEVAMTAAGIAPPGERATFLVPHVGDGYPAVRMSSRVVAIYACPAR